MNVSHNTSLQLIISKILKIKIHLWSHSEDHFYNRDRNFGHALKKFIEHHSTITVECNFTLQSNDGATHSCCTVHCKTEHTNHHKANLAKVLEEIYNNSHENAVIPSASGIKFH